MWISMTRYIAKERLHSENSTTFREIQDTLFAVMFRPLVTTRVPTLMLTRQH